MSKAPLYLMAQNDQLDVEIVTRMLQINPSDVVAIEQVTSINLALTKLSQKHYDALILDLNLSVNNGLDDVKKFLNEYPDLPIVILASTDDHELAIKCLHLGVQDYIYKNQLNAELLGRIMRYAVERMQIHLQLKKALAESDLQNQQLIRLARTDNLTNLPNRAYFFEVAQKALATAERLSQSLGVLYFDLNDFKAINDQYGHTVGDQVLIEIAYRLKNQLRNSDMAARIGGDEFIVLTNMLDDPVQSYSLARKIHQIVCEPIHLNGKTLKVGASIGIATYPQVKSVEKLVQCADMAMYEAKTSKQHFACFYTKHLENKYRKQKRLESALGFAFDADELHALYQPIISPKDTSTLSLEVLCRWHSQKLGEISPTQFIPIAESAHLGDHLSSLMLKETLHLKKFCMSNDIDLSKIAINVFGRQLSDKSFADRLLKDLEELDIPTTMLCVEITERQMVENLSDCQIQLSKLKSQGVTIALDNFGTGFSSVTHLNSLPIDKLKLDRSLIAQIDKKADNRALCGGIIQMAHHLNMKVVAIGIERIEEYQILSDLGCDDFQGFLFGIPMQESAIQNHWLNFNLNEFPSHDVIDTL